MSTDVLNHQYEGQIPYVTDWSAYYRAQRRFAKKKRARRKIRAARAKWGLNESILDELVFKTSSMNKIAKFTPQELDMGLKNTVKMNRIMSKLTRAYLVFDKVFKKEWKGSYKLIRDDILFRLELKLHFKLNARYWSILEDNWPTLWNNALNKFMTWSLPKYNQDAKFKFATFFINQFPDCLEYEFRDFLRRGPVYDSLIWRRETIGFDDVPDVVSYEIEDCTYNPALPLAAEFASKFKAWD